MIKKYIHIICIGGCLFLSGCSNDVATVEGDGNLPILFTASISTSTDVETQNSAQTKAETTSFPNGGHIAILAANATQSGVNSDGWQNLYMDVTATATGTNPTYPVIVDGTTTYYWPFNPEEKLVFVAYSPKDYPHVSNNRTSLNILLKDKMEDVVYTKPTAPLAKTKETVNLGEFQHALAKIRIVVKAIDEAGKPTTAKQFKVTSIKVKTQATSAVFDLTSSRLTSQLATNFTSFPLLSTARALDTEEGVVAELNILPGNEESTYIGLTLTDDVLSYGKDESDSTNGNFGYKLSEFTPETGTEKLAFEAGMITTLTFNIKVTDIQNKSIILKGDLKDWECQGDFEVGIE